MHDTVEKKINFDSESSNFFFISGNVQRTRGKEKQTETAAEQEKHFSTYKAHTVEV